MKTSAPASFLSYNEAAERLRVSVRTVRRYVSDGRLKVKKMSAKTSLVLYPFRDRKGNAFS